MLAFHFKHKIMYLFNLLIHYSYWWRVANAICCLFFFGTAVCTTAYAWTAESMRSRGSTDVPLFRVGVKQLCLTPYFIYTYRHLFTFHQNSHRKYHHVLNENAPKSRELTILTRLLDVTEQVARKTLIIGKILPLQKHLNIKFLGSRGAPDPYHEICHCTLLGASPPSDLRYIVSRSERLPYSEWKMHQNQVTFPYFNALFIFICVCIYACFFYFSFFVILWFLVDWFNRRMNRPLTRQYLTRSMCTYAVYLCNEHISPIRWTVGYDKHPCD